MLASGTEDGSVILWDTATGQQDGPPLAGHADRVNGLAFSPDSKTLASGSIDGTITLWVIKAREPKGHMLHPDGVISMAFDSQGKTLASGGFDGNIILWDTKTMKSLNRAFTEHTDGLYSVAFSPDGRMIAAVYAYQQIILWDIESRQPIIKSFIGDSPAVFIDNGKMLATTVYDTVALWDVDPNSWFNENRNFLVVGPWNHGGWSGRRGDNLGNVDFDSTAPSLYFRANIQAPWFAYFLKDKGSFAMKEAHKFQTGANRWMSYDMWPPRSQLAQMSLYFQKDGRLSFDPPTDQGENSYDEYVSDPAHRVPYRPRPIEPTYGRGSRWFTWLTEDQRFVHLRPDVLSWETETLKQDVVPKATCTAGCTSTSACASLS